MVVGVGVVVVVGVDFPVLVAVVGGCHCHRRRPNRSCFQFSFSCFLFGLSPRSICRTCSLTSACAKFCKSLMVPWQYLALSGAHYRWNSIWRNM